VHRSTESVFAELADAAVGAYDEGQGQGVPVLGCICGFAE
jgi:hypothetical protein